ncbi:hypothetical protein LINGRAHAP2_LOCUS13246 [Linum grandiflorum]
MPKFSSTMIWDTIRPRRGPVTWYSLVWGQPAIHKHSFITWLAITDRLTTRTKMAAWGLSLDVSCLLCDGGWMSCLTFFQIVLMCSKLGATVLVLLFCR